MERGDGVIQIFLNRYVIAGIASLFVVAASYLWLRQHDSFEQGIGEARCEARVAAALAEAQLKASAAQAAYAKQLEMANDRYQHDLAAIPARVINKPVWLHDGQVCAGTVSGTATQTSGTPAGGGGTIGGPGSDIRPQLEAFKAKLETAIAECRRLDAAWP